MDKKLQLSVNNKILAGVCGGIAEYLNVDATVVRLIAVIFTLLGGAGVLAYLIMWLVMYLSK